jgi:hypothetical protein
MSFFVWHVQWHFTHPKKQWQTGILRKQDGTSGKDELPDSNLEHASRITIRITTEHGLYKLFDRPLYCSRGECRTPITFDRDFINRSKNLEVFQDLQI